MRRYSRLSAVVLVAAVATGVLGSRLVPGAQAAVALVKTAPGHILVTPGGMTLYVFAKDKNGLSACTGQCATFWPPLLVAGGCCGVAGWPGWPSTDRRTVVILVVTAGRSVVGPMGWFQGQ